MTDETNQYQKRLTAAKVMIQDILDGAFANDPTNPNLFRTRFGETVGRVNIIATILTKDSVNANEHAVIDDGTGTIMIRSFDNPQILQNIQIGDHVKVVGKPRQFNNQTYIVLEIIKKLSDTAWLEVRKAELEHQNKEKKVVEQESPSPAPQPIIQDTSVNDSSIQETVIEESEQVQDAQSEESDKKDDHDIITVIKELDQGPGVSLEKIEEKLPNIDLKSELDYLLKKGDVFELRPGVVKVLE